MSFGDITISEQEKNIYFRVLRKLEEKRKCHKPLEHSNYFKFTVCVGPSRSHILRTEYTFKEKHKDYTRVLYTVAIEYDLLQNKEKYLLVFEYGPQNYEKEIKDLKTIKDLLFSNYNEIDVFYRKIVGY